MPKGSQLTPLLFLRLGFQSLHLVFSWVGDAPPGPECLPGFAFVLGSPLSLQLMQQQCSQCEHEHLSEQQHLSNTADTQHTGIQCVPPVRVARLLLRVGLFAVNEWRATLRADSCQPPKKMGSLAVTYSDRKCIVQVTV